MATAAPDSRDPADPGADLVAALARILSLLRPDADRPATGISGNRAGPPGARTGAGTTTSPPLLHRIATRLGLSPFECDVVLLCAGAELDRELAQLCSSSAAGNGGRLPTVGLAVEALPGGTWAAFGPGAALRRWRLVELGPSDGLAATPLRLAESVLLHLVGAPQLDDQLVGFVVELTPAGGLAAAQQRAAHELAAVWAIRGGPGGPGGPGDFADHGSPADQAGLLGRQRIPVVRLSGADLADRRAVFAAACALLHLTPYELSRTVVPTPPRETETLGKLWAREALLRDAALFITAEDGPQPPPPQVLASFIERTEGCLAVDDAAVLGVSLPEQVDVSVPPLDAADRRAAWQSALASVQSCARTPAERREPDPAPPLRFAAQFDFGGIAIRAAASEAATVLRAAHADGGGETDPGDGQATDPEAVLWAVSRRRARAMVGGLAERVTSTPGWADLMLPEPVLKTLRAIILAVRHRARVHEDWGFTGHRGGPGVSALFAGASGTGKTMAANVLAAELQLDLYRVDLSAVVSKYIGQTEKNLARVFEAAERSGAVLFFDEADALFGRRSEVRDSHDRYANLEVSYLLQRMESYRGLAVLATNLADALDTAFLRRLRFVVRFPFPDPEQRTQIWSRAFPAATPVAGLNVERLAALQVSGGSIRNIALGAAVAAAESAGPVTMHHLLAAALQECEKQQRPVLPEEVRGWT